MLISLEHKSSGLKCQSELKYVYLLFDLSKTAIHVDMMVTTLIYQISQLCTYRVLKKTRLTFLGVFEKEWELYFVFNFQLQAIDLFSVITFKI